MPSNNIILVNIALAAIAVILSIIAIYFYSRRNKRFLSGEFKSYASWMMLGVVIYTVHLLVHLAEEANRIGWIKVNENAVSLSLHALLAIAGIFFLIGSYFYLKLSDSIGYKR